MEIITMPIIMAIVYIIMQTLKIAFKAETFQKLIPMISAFLGLGFGLLVFFVSPEILGKANIFDAILIGLCSGLGATGGQDIISNIFAFKKEKGVFEVENISNDKQTENKKTASVNNKNIAEKTILQTENKDKNDIVEEKQNIEGRTLDIKTEITEE